MSPLMKTGIAGIQTFTSSIAFFYRHPSLILLSLVPSSLRFYQMWNHLQTPAWMEVAVLAARLLLPRAGIFPERLLERIRRAVFRPIQQGLARRVHRPAGGFYRPPVRTHEPPPPVGDPPAAGSRHPAAGAPDGRPLRGPRRPAVLFEKHERHSLEHGLCAPHGRPPAAAQTKPGLKLRKGGCA